MTLLCAYLVDGVPVNDVVSFDGDDLSGNEPYQFVDTVPAGYQDESSIELWWYLWEQQTNIYINKDYKFVRNEIIVLAATIGWSSLTTEEKTRAACIFAVGKTERDEIYTLDQQIALGLQHHIKSIEARTLRLAKTQMQLYNRLAKADWEEVASDASSLLPQYVNQGIEGTVEGDLEGLFDYVDGDARTGTTWDTTGGFRNKSYSVEGYADCDAFADDILDILKNGNYS